LSWPMLASKRLRGLCAAGWWSSFSVPGAGIEISEDEYSDGRQD